MKHLIKFESLDSTEKQYQSLRDDDYYRDVCDSIFLEIDYYFKDKNRFFPLCVKVSNINGYYFGSICMG